MRGRARSRQSAKRHAALSVRERGRMVRDAHPHGSRRTPCDRVRWVRPVRRAPHHEGSERLSRHTLRPHPEEAERSEAVSKDGPRHDLANAVRLPWRARNFIMRAGRCATFGQLARRAWLDKPSGGTDYLYTNYLAECEAPCALTARAQRCGNRDRRLPEAARPLAFATC
jgi:hypothetical protein